MPQDVSGMQKTLAQKPADNRSSLQKFGDKVVVGASRAVDAAFRPRDPQKAAAYNKQRIAELKQASANIKAGKTLVKSSSTVDTRISQLENEGK